MGKPFSDKDSRKIFTAGISAFVPNPFRMFIAIVHEIAEIRTPGGFSLPAEIDSCTIHAARPCERAALD
jgi:hypothetical protein